MNNSKLIDAATQYMEAKAELAAARQKYDGHSWDYAGGHYIDRMEAAEKDWSDAIDQSIRDYVAKLLSECESFADLKRMMETPKKETP